MKLIKIALAMVAFFVFTDASMAQNVKPKFKDLTLVIYRVNDSTKKLAVTIEHYYHINAQGIIRNVINMRTLDGGSDANYNGVLRDTTYQLNNDNITELNKIFNGKKALNAYFNAKPAKVSTIIGPGGFISYTSINGMADKLVFDQDFFDRDMNLTLNGIMFSKLARITHNTGIFHDKGLEAEILKYHLTCKCLPVNHGEPPVVK